MLYEQIIDEIEFSLQEERKAFSVPYKIRHQIALKLKADGFPPFATTAIDDCIYLGYGLLDCNGFWQYPL